MVYDIEPGDIYNEKGYFGLSLAHKTEANPNNKKTLKGYSLEKHNRIIKEKDQEILKKDERNNFLNGLLMERDKKLNDKEGEIAALRACKEIDNEPECIRLKKEVDELKVQIIEYNKDLSDKDRTIENLVSDNLRKQATIDAAGNQIKALQNKIFEYEKNHRNEDKRTY